MLPTVRVVFSVEPVRELEELSFNQSESTEAVLLQLPPAATEISVQETTSLLLAAKFPAGDATEARTLAYATESAFVPLTVSHKCCNANVLDNEVFVRQPPSFSVMTPCFEHWTKLALE